MTGRDERPSGIRLPLSFNPVNRFASRCSRLGAADRGADEGAYRVNRDVVVPIGLLYLCAARAHSAARSTPYVPYVWQPIRSEKKSWLERLP